MGTEQASRQRRLVENRALLRHWPETKGWRVSAVVTAYVRRKSVQLSVYAEARCWLGVFNIDQITSEPIRYRRTWALRALSTSDSVSDVNRTMREWDFAWEL